MTYRAIGEKIRLSLERVRSLHNRAIKKMSKPENASYYKEGYVKTQVSLQEEKEQYARMIMEKVSEAAVDKGIEKTSVYDMDMSVRTVNCLTRSGIYTIEDILALLAKDPANLLKIRNLGRVSYTELVSKLLVYGIKVEKL